MRLFALFLLLPVVCLGAPKILLSADTESELKNKISTPKEIVQLIMQDDQDDAKLFNECLIEKGLEKDSASSFFDAVAIDLNDDGLPDFFVRPAIKPYCHVFYGAHLFRYWFVTSHRQNGKIHYKIAFKNGSDQVELLNSRTNNYRDLVSVGHSAVEFYTSTLRFNGREYESVNCKKQTFGLNDKITSPC
jgi:hypothetical protein